MGTVGGLAFAAEVQPPVFHFITVDETRLRYLDSGSGTPVVLLHGNGSMIEDFVSSGIMDHAPGHRFIAFDRPGFGYSERPRGREWGPSEQAQPPAARIGASGDRAPSRRRPLVGSARGPGHGAGEPRGRGWAGAPVGVLLSGAARETGPRRVSVHARCPAPHGCSLRPPPHGPRYAEARLRAVRGSRDGSRGPIRCRSPCGRRRCGPSTTKRRCCSTPPRRSPGSIGS